MEKIERKTYEAPQLTAVVFKSERGFALSNFNLARPDGALFFDETKRSLEDYNSHSTWGDDEHGDYFWN